MILEASIANQCRFRRRSGGWFILSTAPGSYKMRAGFPLLLEHDRSRKIGSALSWRHEAGVIYATFLFYDRAIYDDVRQGRRQALSIKIDPIKTELNGPLDTTLYRSWSIDEVSIVRYPANPTVGFGKKGIVAPGTSASLLVDRPTRETMGRREVKRCYTMKT